MFILNEIISHIFTVYRGDVKCVLLIISCFVFVNGQIIFLFCMIKSFNCVVILLYFSTHRESYLITFSSPVTGIKSWHCTFLQTTDISNLDFYIHVILNSDNMYVS